MWKYIGLLITAVVHISLSAQEYYPDETKWTEIRLDTMKYDTWFFKIGDDWIPNFETVQYLVSGDYYQPYSEYTVTYKCVYTSSNEWSDSLTLLVLEDKYGIQANVPRFNENGLIWFPGTAYVFDGWTVGMTLHYQDIEEANVPSIPAVGMEKYGMVEDIKTGMFGGVRPLSYVDLNGVRIIRGIGVTTWNDGECLFGPVNPYQIIRSDMEPGVRHYRSMLVHFERGGEVLYDVWPSPDGTGVESPLATSPRGADDAIYDLQGRRLNAAPNRGLYIQGGKMRMAW